MTYVGIDPGLGGAIAFLYPDLVGADLVVPMPLRPGPTGKTEVDAKALLNLLPYHSDDTLVTVETVHSMPKQSAQSGFSFGKSYGKVLGVLEAFGYRHQFVTPQAWKRIILSGLGREKADAIRWARSMYPKIDLRRTPKCTTLSDGMAEALAIAEYGRRLYLGVSGTTSQKGKR